MTDTHWSKKYRTPPLEEIQRVGADNWEVFKRQAEVIEPVISSHLKSEFGFWPWSKPRKVLDFGCGIGRVALKMHAEKNWPTHGCDVNRIGAAYLQRQIPEIQVFHTEYDPPLPFEAQTFDAVYSVSVWTHMPEDAQDRWLKEMARILKPGGLALITTSGYKALETRRKRGDPGWTDIKDEDLKERGFIYMEYERFRARKTTDYPGITDSYGLTAHDDDYIRRHWGEFLDVRAIKRGVISNVQDLVICTARNVH
ncbi:class I SAM-dependent methyltransferase [Mesorhizobium sp. CGMCC 1.15528]|uniref:Class I SAM-dependent methyltransferase n=1 Tax=Mesorhizobium zhangyense TaxID=1776730 RepID=A0A7C9V8M1_9HYPH|nr:class I SAM-dependent methyltransferase [Mesorhizobium zhangyense]NGN43485.1 class I SAM-dependent methyltransferase [Mesorhizobium zhangyense]